MRVSVITTILISGALLLASCNGGGPATSREHLVGAVLSLDGIYEHYGTSIQNGIEIAVEEINNDGGINGVPYKIEVKNSHSTVEGAAAAMNELSQEHYEIVIGAETTDLTAELIPIAASKKMVLMSPSATSPSLRRIKSNGFFFRICPTDDNEAQKIYEEIIRAHPRFPFIKRASRKILTLVLRNSAYTDGLWFAFGHALLNNKDIQYEHLYYEHDALQAAPGENGEFDDQMKEIIAKVGQYQLTDKNEKDPPAVVIFGFADDVETLLRAFKTQHFKLNCYSSSSVDTESFLSDAGEFADGLVFPRVFDPKSVDNPNIVDFVGRYKTKYNSEPDLYAAYGYDCAKLIALTLRRDDIDDAIEEPRNLRLLMNDEHFDGLTGRVDFSQENNEVIKNFLLYKIVDGVPVFIDEYENKLELEKYQEMRELRERQGVGH